ncbi:hypothetical protein ACQP1W_22420 [Spirillospora sp. CA-255316]
MWETLHAAGIDPAPRRAGPTRRQFPAAQSHAIIACDVLVVEAVPLKRLYVQPGHGPADRIGTLRFLIHNRDPVRTAASNEVFKAEACVSSRPCGGRHR